MCAAGSGASCNQEEGPRVNRRIFEMMIIVTVLAKPVLGSTRLWAHKTFAATEPGSITHSVAEVAVILLT
jgi:hypothetical protein